MKKYNKNQYKKKGMLKTVTLKEQCSDAPFTEIKVNILSEGGQLWLRPQGYGDKCSVDGEGWPIGIEIWQGQLRLIVYYNINREDPHIIDLEKSKESCRIEDTQGCNYQCACTDYCAAAEYLADQGRKIFTRLRRKSRV
jgi:hypothetical protein